MTTATTTTRRPRAKSDDDILRSLDIAAQKAVAAQKLLDEIVAEHGPDPFTPQNVRLSRAAWAVLEEQGAKSIFEMCRKLEWHRGILNLRTKYGNPAVLRQAREELAKAEDAEASAEAAARDIEVGDGDGPALARQIKKLQAIQGELAERRQLAAARVKECENARRSLFAGAPEFLRREVDTEIDRVRPSHPIYQAILDLKNRIHTVTAGVAKWLAENRMDEAHEGTPVDDRNFSREGFEYVYVCQMYRPEWVDQNGPNSRKSIEKRRLIELMTWVEREEYPRLKDELRQREREWQAVIDQISLPLIRWAETGQFD